MKSKSVNDIIAITTPNSDGVDRFTLEINNTLDEMVTEVLDPLELDPKTINDLKKYLFKLRKEGPASPGLICAGDACAYKKACPLWRSKKEVMDHGIKKWISQAPEGLSCPLETTVKCDVKIRFNNLDGVDLNNPIHFSYLNELMCLASVEWRTHMLLMADGHNVVQDVPAAVLANGDIAYRKEYSQLLEIIFKVQERRSKIYRELVLTPEAEIKKKALLGEDKSAFSQKQSEEHKRIKEIGTGIVPIPSHVKTIGTSND